MTPRSEDLLTVLDAGSSKIRVLVAELHEGALRYRAHSVINAEGMRTMFFTLNGQTRNLEVRDQSVEVKTVHNAKADRADPKQLASPLQGLLSKVLVQPGQQVAKNAPLFVIEAMKMETTITAPADLTVGTVALSEGTRVQADDLVLTVA